MNKEELKLIIEFMKETDKFKTTFRSPYLSQELNRQEDDAQHSWHLALFVMLTKKYFNSNLNYTRMIELALIHDLVEIYAGDTFAFDEENRKTKKERENKAAQKLFAQLPKNLEEKFHLINSEYELKTSQEAKIVGALDKIVPIIQNLIADHKAWKKHSISLKQIQDFIDEKARINDSAMNEISDIIANQVNNAFNCESQNNKKLDYELELIIEFLKETDKLKSTLRATKLSQESRFEDAAQHSWHTALFIILLKDHLNPNINYTKLLELSITHDLVEIYSGDVFAFDENKQDQKFKDELQSAQKLFKILPKDLCDEFHNLNDEYMNRVSDEANHLSAINKLIPSIQNKISNYYSWKIHTISKEQIIKLYKKHCEINDELKELVDVIKEDILDYK